MARGKFTWLAGVLMLAISGISAKAQDIDFDDVADGTVINNQYPGVTFTAVATPSGSADVYARSTSTLSAPNAISLFSSGLPFFDRRWGGIQATFATPKNTVSINVRPVLPPEYFPPVVNQPFLQAFDAAGHLLGKVYYPIAYGASGYGNWRTLTIHTATNNIKYVQFSSQYGYGSAPVYAQFDNLTYSAAKEMRRVGLRLSAPWFDRRHREYRATLTITNAGSTTIKGALQVVQTVFFSGYGNMENANGTFYGCPYVTVPISSLAPKASVDVELSFGRGKPSLSFVSALRIYSGDF